MDQIKILVTGANGFIGTYLLPLLKTSFDVLGLQRAGVESSGMMNVDYCNQSELNSIFNSFQPNVVIHLASNTSRTRSMSELPLFLESNVKVTNAILLAGSTLSKPPKYIFLSSAEVYGPQSGRLSEDAPLNPASPYGISKVYSEELFSFYHRNYGISAHILRLFNAYGVGQSKGFFFADILDAHKNKREFQMTRGEQKRDFIYIGDVVRAIEMFIHRPDILEYVNLSSGNALSLNAITTLFNEKVNGSLNVNQCLPYRTNELWEVSGNNNRLLSLGFTINFTIEMGLNAMLEYEKV